MQATAPVLEGRKIGAGVDEPRRPPSALQMASYAAPATRARTDQRLITTSQTITAARAT